MRMDSKVCRICGDKGLCFNYDGEQSCASCRVFFYRNAPKLDKLKCPKEDKCEIDFVSRKSCPKCRLDKCFAIGMKYSDSVRRTRRPNPTAKPPSLINSKDLLKKVATLEAAKSIVAINSKIAIERMLESRIQNQITSISSKHDNENFESIPPIPCLTLPLTIATKHSLKLNSYEQTQIGAIHRTIANVFEEESTLPLLREEVKSSVYFTDTVSVYSRRVVRLCKSIEVFKALNQEDQLALLKPFIFDFAAIRAAFQYNHKQNMFRLLGDENGNQALMVQACDKVDYPTNNLNLLHRNIMFMYQFNLEMENDYEIRNLLTALQLVKPLENYNCPESIRYQYYVYSHLLLRYLEHKYNDLELAHQKFHILTEMLKSDLTEMKENVRKVMLEFGTDHITEVVVESLNLNE